MSLIPSSGEQPVPRCGSERERGVSRALSTVQSNAVVGRGRGEAGGVSQPGPPRALTLAEELASLGDLGRDPPAWAQFRIYDFPRYKAVRGIPPDGLLQRTSQCSGNGASTGQILAVIMTVRLPL